MRYLFYTLLILFLTGCDIEYQKVLITEKELAEYPPIIEAIRQVESGGHGPKAVSSKGARGSMQVMPATAISLGYHPDEMFDHDKAMEAGSKYYHQLLNETCKGNVHCALRSYFCGPGKREMKVCYRYADKVLREASKHGYKAQATNTPKPSKKGSKRHTARATSVSNELTVETQTSWKGYSFAINEESTSKRR